MRSNEYRPLLQLPAIRWQAAAGLLAQVTQGAAAVGIILVVRERTGSLALAGGVVGALSVAAGIARPVQGRLIDRRGSRAVLPACGVVHGLALAGIVLFAHLDAGGALLVALGVVAGLALPPISTSMRVEWGAAGGEADHTAAYSLVYLTQELAILTGPLILAAVIALSSASAALIVVAVVAAAGTVGFAVSVRSSGGQRPRQSPGTAVMRIRGMQLLLAIALLVGAVIGALEVAAPTLAAAHHAPAAAGLLIASLSVGGILGAAFYGGRRWRASPSRRLLALLCALAGLLTVLTAAENLWLAGALLLLVGIPLNPALTTFSLLVDRHVPAPAAGEAFGWLSTALAGGTGAASAVAAAVAQDRGDPRAAFIVAAIAGIAAVALSGVVRHALDRG